MAVVPTPDADDVARAVEDAHRREWAHVLTATVRVTRDLEVAEDCTQDAFAQALVTWPASGVPARPGAWLTTVARRRALDRLRRDALFRRAMPELVMDAAAAGPADAPEPDAVADDLLRLVFTCCHPALSREAQVALTLRLLCGLSTADVARAFLVREPAMAARLTRAKRKIAAARIPYRVPSADELPARVGAVLEVLHLVFTTGHAAPVGDDVLRGDLLDGAVRLARLLHGLLPDEPDVAALLALMLLTDARRDARVSPTGEPVLLPDQDRTRWDAALVAEGTALLTDALRRRPGRYAVQAAIAAVHAEAPTWERTDWAEVVGLYDVLLRLWPSPVVALNRAVAVGERDGAGAGLAALAPLLADPSLATYAWLSAARADLLRRLGRRAEAAEAYAEAVALTENAADRAFLARRLDEVRAGSG